MRGFNRAIIAGNLTRDPDVRYTASKKAVARFTLAVSNRYRDNNGEYKDSVDYINVVAWGYTAENSGKYLKKGSPVLVEGRIKTGSYEAKDGSGRRYTTEIWIDSMTMLGSAQGQQGGSRNSGDRGFNGPSMGLDYMPSDDDFGLPIGEKGFGPDSMDDPDPGQDSGSDIPF